MEEQIALPLLFGIGFLILRIILEIIAGIDIAIHKFLRRTLGKEPLSEIAGGGFISVGARFVAVFFVVAGLLTVVSGGEATAGTIITLSGIGFGLPDNLKYGARITAKRSRP